MELTGKAKEQFVEWYLPKDNYHDGYNEHLIQTDPVWAEILKY